MVVSIQVLTNATREVARAWEMRMAPILPFRQVKGATMDNQIRLLAYEVDQLDMSLDVANARLARNAHLRGKLDGPSLAIGLIIARAVTEGKDAAGLVPPEYTADKEDWARALLLAACAVVDPSSALLAECARAGAYEVVDVSAMATLMKSAVPLDTLLIGTPSARAIRVVNTSGLPVYAKRDSVRVGDDFYTLVGTGTPAGKGGYLELPAGAKLLLVRS